MLKKAMDYFELNYMIEEITKGDLGERIKNDQYYLSKQTSIDVVYSYTNEKITLNYHQQGYRTNRDPFTFKQSHIVYYDGKLVYKGYDDKKLRKLYNPEWVKEIYKVYKEHLENQEKKRQELRTQQENLEKLNKVRKVLELLHPNEYHDDKIIIDNIEVTTSSYYSSTEGGNITEYNYLGRISLIDGTEVCDIAKGIYHPGKWEDYVISLLPALEEKKRQEQARRKAIYDEKVRKAKEEKQKIYEYNHRPIDDSKYFK